MAEQLGLMWEWNHVRLLGEWEWRYWLLRPLPRGWSIISAPWEDKNG